MDPAFLTFYHLEIASFLLTKNVLQVDPTRPGGWAACLQSQVAARRAERDRK